MVKKQPDFVFNISPGLNVKSAYISKDPISIEESVFRPDQLNLIEKIINNEISNIENEYQQKLEAEKKTAWQNGNQAGIKQTHNQLSQQVQNLLNNLNQLINNLQIQSDKIIENHEQDILTLILKIARKVIETEISLNPDIILEVLKKSLNLLNEK
ncbi:MAG: FliH/SctL family protein, partial [Endomicrobiaceae bacterium]